MWLIYYLGGGEPTWPKALGVADSDQTGIVDFGLRGETWQDMRQNSRIVCENLPLQQSVNEHSQTERRLCPACIWQRCRSECCCCRRSRPEWPLSPAPRSPSGRWSHRTRSHRYCEKRFRKVYTYRFLHCVILQTFSPLDHWRFSF